MKLIPKKSQWDGWTLPSKASYIGCVVGILALIIAVIIALIQSSHDKTENQPQLAVNFSSKPYLRYKKIGDSGMEFSYEICIKTLVRTLQPNLFTRRQYRQWLLMAV